MRKLLLSTVALLFTAIAAFADGNVTFEVNAPRAVAAGELFRVEFVVNANPSEFVPPAIEGFEILAGPTSSRSQSVSIVNGEISRSTNISYTYVLQGFTPGIFTIPSAQVTVKGKTYSTRPVAIEIVAEANGQAQQQGAAAQGGGSSEARQSSGAGLSPDDLLARVTVSKNRVYKGEPVHVALKLYSRVPFGLDNLKSPSFNGFWQQDISVEPHQQRETYNNRVYDAWVIQEYLLYPQQSGTLTIDPFELSIVAQIQVQGSGSRGLFDDLFGPNIQEIRRKVSSSPVKVEVSDWPSGAPESFNGAVGQFRLEAAPPQRNMIANTSGTYTIRLSGTGNFPLIRAPRIELPTSFEEYNIKSSESIKHSRSGTSGYRQFEYPFIPRMEGSYTIPEVQFSYFDPQQIRYVTLKAYEVQIDVAADSTAVAAGGNMVSGLSKEDLKILGHDIRFIKLGSPEFKSGGKLVMWSPLYFSLAALAVALFFAALLLLRRHLKNMQNDRFVRGKRANKVALKRFRAAEQSMKQGDKNGFYDEMLKALWGYMSDKLGIPMAKLTKERIREELFERSIPEMQANEYIRIISACEEAQYSPTTSTRMNELYKEGVNLVSDLESAIKM